ncbi:MAG: ABC transporter ATP-binding protein [Actinomycetota bacterium]
MSSVIEIRNLSKRYGHVEAVTDLCLSIPEGESFGYLGPNGAGKTTTIRCMLGFISPSAGNIELFGRDARRHRVNVLARIGYLPGEFGLWPSMTGSDHLAYLGRLHPAPPRARTTLCERFELSDADLGRQVRHYSRGMKQKLGLIQAFQHEPELIMLDEPTEGLDPVMQERFLELVREHRDRGGTVFMSSHILSEVQAASDRVAVIKQGRLVKVGPASDLSGGHVRHCALQLKAPARAGLLDDVAGIEALVVNEDRTAFIFDFRGEMEPLVERLAGAGVIEFLARPESLTEAFFDIYGER